jgi:hypothetical protein
MKSCLIAPILLMVTISVMAQRPDIVFEDWTGRPSLHAIPERYRKESAIILLDNRKVEYVDGKNDLAGEYRTLHRIVRLNDDNGIESFNKIYLGVSDTSEIVDLHARTILPGGKVIDIDRRNIKDVQEEDGSKYKIFAMEGLEKGCEIEYTYTTKRDMSYFGREVMQGPFPIIDARLQVICPKRLLFQLKGYNCTAPVADSDLDVKRVFSVLLQDIPGADDEKYATYNADLQRVEYRLSYNSVHEEGKARLNTWEALAKRIHEVYESYTDKDLKAAAAMIGPNGWDRLSSEESKIMAVENYVKKQFTTREDIDMQNAGNIEWVIKNKIASHAGMIRLFSVIFDRLGIDNQIVLTCSRDEAVIDKSFENWSNASQFLFYFPSSKKFMAPTLLYVRYPWIDPYWEGADALFCKTTTIGTYTTALATIKRVPTSDDSLNFSRLDARLQLNPGLDTLLIDLKQSYGGYLAGNYREAFTLANADEQHNFLKEMIKATTNSERVVSSKIENSGLENYNENKPFVLSATVKSSEMLESAGNKILVKIGNIIGPQVEMYQEKARLFPIQLPFAHSYERSVNFVIPDGYQVKNPDDLVIRHEYKTDGETEVTVGFTSDYKIEGNVIHIHILEVYKRIFYPLSEYDNFKKVINSAADFNKVVMVLEKK